MKTTQGGPVHIEMCYGFNGNPYPAWFEELSRETNVPALDLSDHLTAFRISFSPLAEYSGGHHLCKEGHSLISRLLAYELISRKIIPFEAAKNN
jgi:hypothetical protein